MKQHIWWLVTPAALLVVLPFVASLLTIGGHSLVVGDQFGNFDNWSGFLADVFNWQVVWATLRLGFVVTAITVVVAYPTAAALARLQNRVAIAASYTVIFAPLLISVIVRTYGWFLLLSDTGAVNTTIAQIGLGPYRLIYNEKGAVIALVHVLLPFAVFPLLSTFRQIPEHYREAALDLGARRHEVFFKVMFPLSLPGLLAAAEIVFALAVSSFVTPTLLGGGRIIVLSKLIYDNIGDLQWGVASVQALILLAMVTLIVTGFRQLIQLAKLRGGRAS